MPVIGEVVAASPSNPYLCLKLDLDCTQLSDLLLDARLPINVEEQPDLGLSVSLLTPEMLDAATRLMGLLDKPWAVGTLGPLYERELLYFLLAGPQGGRLRQMALAEGRTAQIVKAVRWIRARFREAIAVEDAAAIAGMNPSSFHEHFKAVTAHSPLLRDRGGAARSHPQALRGGSRHPSIYPATRNSIGVWHRPNRAPDNAGQACPASWRELRRHWLPAARSGGP
jgi:AraC-like DNA-binding protein